MGSPPMSKRRTSLQTVPVADILSLHDARLSRRVENYRVKLDHVLEENKRAVSRLAATGVLFTRHGVRTGRDLLLAHEHLLRVVGLVDRLANEGDVPAPRRADEIDAIFMELDTLLTRTCDLAAHTAHLLEELGND